VANSSIVTKIAIIFLIILCGCIARESTELREALVLYRENDLRHALPLFEEIVSQRTNDAEAHAWLAETYRRLGMKDEAVRTASRALELEQCNSFAHRVIADACRRPPGDPGQSESDTNWVHLNRAITCDSTDGVAWVSVWNEAILREKFDIMRKAVRKMKETGFLTKAALAYGRWMLRTLPENAILITTGDMDTFPALAVQATEGFRADVTVVERGLLGTKQFLHFIRDYVRIPLPLRDSHIDSLIESADFPENISRVSSQIFKGWLDVRARDAFAHPLAIAVTVEESFYTDIEGCLQYAGPFLLWRPTPSDSTPDTTALRVSLEGIRPEDFSGPWVSTQDRSPVRIRYTKEIVRNITLAALAYAEELIQARRFTEAEKVLSWAEQFEEETELGPIHSERVSHLRGVAQRGRL